MLFVAMTLTLADLAWLAGDWQMTKGEQCIEEHWTAPGDRCSATAQRSAVRRRVEREARGPFAGQCGDRRPVPGRGGDVRAARREQPRGVQPDTGRAAVARTVRAVRPPTRK